MLLSATRPRALVTRFRIALGETELIDLCREAARLDETLLTHLLPYLPFRTAKQRLAAATPYALAWATKNAEDLSADLAEAMAVWASARRRLDRRECRQAQRLVAGLLRIAGSPAGDLLWREDAGYDLACQVIG